MSRENITAITAGVALLMLCHALALSSVMKYRRGKRTVIPVWAGVIVLTCVLTWLSLRFLSLQASISCGFVFALAALAAVTLILTDYPLPKQCFLLINYFNIYIVINSVSTLLAQHTPHMYLYTVLFRTAFYAVAVPLSQRFLRRRICALEIPGSRDWWLLTAAAAVFFALLAERTALTSSVYFYDDPKETAYLLVIFTLLFATYAVIFRTIGYLQRLSAAEASALRSKLYEVQLASMREAEEDARRTRHDLRHHDLVILEYLNEGNYDGLREYLGDGNRISRESPYRRFCENDTANSVLSAYYRKALAANVKVELSAVLPQRAGLEPDDIVAILANLMDNAVRGAADSGAEEPFMELTMQPRGQKLVIRSRNSCAPDTLLRDGKPTRKSGFGVGVDSILHALRRYDGEADFSVDDGVFTCQILLNLPEIPNIPK